MSITLITGVPGSGKSVYAMTFIQDLLCDGRPLYVHGIPNLKIKHTQVLCNSLTCEVCPSPPVKPHEPDILDFTARHDQQKQYQIDLLNYNKFLIKYEHDKSNYDKHLKADEWHNWAPDGALIIYDEVQNVYRPRSSSSKVPPSVSAFETHRHKGLDFYLVTQSPLLFDTNIRRLVGRHIHLRPTWAGRFQYEFPECNDNTRILSTGVKSKYKLNKSVFSLYKSSSLHTKQQKKIPFIAYVLLIFIFIFLLIGYRIKSRYDTVSIEVDPKETPIEIPLKINPSKPSALANLDEVPLSDDKLVNNFKSFKDLLKVAYSGIFSSDVSKLPTICHQTSKQTIKCKVPKLDIVHFPNYICMVESCYVYLTINENYSFEIPHSLNFAQNGAL